MELPGKNEVHIWSISLPEFGTQASRYLSWLSAKERERSSRMRFQYDRLRFIVARGQLRQLLACYLDQSPESLRFDEGRYGKPMLMDCNQDLRFNLSHSGERVMYAVSCGREVGIDVEIENPKIEWMQMAKQFFAPMEWRALEELGAEQGRQAFMKLWSNKEALYKAIGAGFSLAPDEVPISFVEESQRVKAKNLAGDEVFWSLTNLGAELGYYAAVAVQGEVMSLPAFLSASTKASNCWPSVSPAMMISPVSGRRIMTTRRFVSHPASANSPSIPSQP